MYIRPCLKFVAVLALALPLSGCLTQRTVTRNGKKVEQGLIVKRPLKEAVDNSR
ncbi:MAG: hypothetical protein QM755_04265 [Luteolibacter sp.]